MGKIKVKSESLPERCEICHQHDCFEPRTGYCSRCAIVSASATTDNITLHPDLVKELHYREAQLMSFRNTDVIQLFISSLIFLAIGLIMFFLIPSLYFGYVFASIGTAVLITMVIFVLVLYAQKRGIARRFRHLMHIPDYAQPIQTIMRMKLNYIDSNRSYYVALYETSRDQETHPAYHLIILR